jgi:hypothetical protein
MDDFGRYVRYLFVLSVLLLFFAYWAGANKLLGTSIAGVNTLGLTFTGRNAAGNFAAYPTGGPA